MIRVRCPKCNSLLGLDDSAAGAMGQCPACEQTFCIPLAEPTVLEPADEDEEISDAQPVEQEVEWGRDVPRERKKRRRRTRQSEMALPDYLQERQDPELGPLGSFGSLKRIGGFALMGLGMVSICGGWATSMTEAAGKTGSAGICTGIAFGAIFLVVGLYLILKSD